MMKDDYEEAYNEINFANRETSDRPMLGSPGMMTQIKKDLISLSTAMGHVTFKSFVRRMQSTDEILVSKIVFAILFIVLSTLIVIGSFIMSAIGFFNIGYCEIQPMIPIWLMIFGIVMLANAVLNIFLIDYCCPTKTALGVSRLLLHVLNGVFNLVWLIIGTVWIMTVRPIVMESNYEKCDYVCFRTSFMHMLSVWFVLAILLVVFVLYLLYTFIKTTCNRRR